MLRLNRRDFPGAHYSERVIQFGEGNFLRAFIDWQLDWLNQHQHTDAGVVVVRIFPCMEAAFRVGWVSG